MTGKKAPKVEALVVSAIRRLQDVQGSTPREISNYIAQEYDVPGPEIKKQVQLALKRGVSYGILQRSKGMIYKKIQFPRGYYSCNRDFLAKQPMETGDVEMRCRPRRRRMARSCIKRSRRARRRRSSRCAKRTQRRSCKRRASRRRCVKRRRSSRRGCGRKRSRRRRSRRRRRGKRCASEGIFETDAMAKQPPKRRDDSGSRHESQSDRSSVSGSSDDRRMDNQDPQSITPPITHMD